MVVIATFWQCTIILYSRVAYRIAWKFGEGFNLVIWRFGDFGLNHQIKSSQTLACSQPQGYGRLARVHCTATTNIQTLTFWGISPNLIPAKFSRYTVTHLYSYITRPENNATTSFPLCSPPPSHTHTHTCCSVEGDNPLSTLTSKPKNCTCIHNCNTQHVNH